MKKTTLLKLLSLFLFIFLVGCKDQSNDQKTSNFATAKADYSKFLKTTNKEVLKRIDTEIEFWQTKYLAAQNQTTYLLKIAGLYSQRFDVLGNIEDLYKAEDLLKKSNTDYKGTNASIHRSIAKNYISQHRFKEAKEHVILALEIGENKLGSQKMLFDVNMELGDFDSAKINLNDIKDLKDFDYLIRLAKWNDHIGKLDDAILFMEKAMKIAEEEKNEGLQIWVYSNIADFYGHAGRIEDSYAYYLKTLEIEPSNAYALKGIAWITFSHEKNEKATYEILEALKLKHDVPDLYLLEAEVADYFGNSKRKDLALSTYKSKLESHNYGDMYNKYNVLLYTDETNQFDKALLIAQEEVANRPTPESYDLLAWSNYKKGYVKEALTIIKEHTIDKSHEPLILFHNEVILKANKMESDNNQEVKKELLASVYELGPSMQSEIEKL